MKLLFQMAILVLVTSVLTFGAMAWFSRDSGLSPAILPTQPPDSMAGRVALVTAKGCPGCHSLDGQEGVGPSWMGVWGQLREFTDGSGQVFDEAYFRESISNPGARVVKGFQNVMIPADLNEAEAEQVLLLITELGKPGNF